MRRAANERGIALAVAIFALVVVGALVAGAFFVGFQEQTVGRNTVRAQQAFAAAQEGAHLQVASWVAGVNNQMPVGATAQFQGVLGDGTGSYRGTVRRLNNMLFLIETEGFSRDRSTRQKVGLLVRLQPIEIEIESALRTQGAIRIGGSAYINGYDNLPPGWAGCPALDDPLPGISTSDTTLITYSGCTGGSCVRGDPRLEQDTSISSSTLTTFGDLSWDDIPALATKTLDGGNRRIQPSTTASGACNTADLNNWGDPLNPSRVCGTYFPIIYVRGNLNINGVQGQGLLFVDGDLSVQGNFQFYGPVVVRGMLRTTGTGGHFNGGVIAANVDLEQNTVLGNAVVNYSSCAVLRALTYTAPGSLIEERSWVNLYN